MKKYIYKFTNKINNKIYIGQAKNWKSRYNQHKNYKLNEEKDTKALYLAFEKYGFQNFDFEIIEYVENYNEREQYWIQYYNSYYNGYNMTVGGDIPPIHYGNDNINTRHNPADIEKLQDLMLNTNISFEILAKQFNFSMSGIIRINNGVIWHNKKFIYPLRKNKSLIFNQERGKAIIEDLLYTELTQKQIAKKYNVSRSTITMINVGKNCYCENIEYPIRSEKENRHSKSCLMLDVETKEILKEFTSLSEASKFLNKKRGNTNIANAIKNNKKAYGFYWKYKD